MTPSEFKCWFQGYTEALEGTPSETQWKRIKARVDEIDGRAITEHVYINRYVPNWYYGYPYYGQWTVGSTTMSGSSCNIGYGTGTANLNLASAAGNLQNASFDSHAAMLSLGRAEAQEFNS
jgi:hypothetical protein